MRVLVAEDDPVSSRLLTATLATWGYEALATRDGLEAWEVLRSAGSPPLAILDGMMPGLDGVDLCRKVRAARAGEPLYLILLSARGTKENVVEGLKAGANDYMIKPFEREELRARLEVGLRVLHLQSTLAQRVAELEAALAQIKQLQGLLPICMYCKKIRDDQNYWQRLETYICSHSQAQFSHGICPECYERLLPRSAAADKAGRLSS